MSCAVRANSGRPNVSASASKSTVLPLCSREPRLGAQDPRHGVVNALHRQPARGRRLAQRCDRSIRFERRKQDIRSRQDRAHRDLARRIAHRHAAHVQIVSHYQAVKSQLVPQYFRRDVLRKRRRNVCVRFQRRHGQMPGHHRADARFDRRAKRWQLDAFEARAIPRDCRQVEVRIQIGIAVPRKMLRRRQSAVFFHATHKRRRQRAHALRIFAERANIDDGIGRIAVDVAYRRENPGHARRSRLQRRDLAHRVCVFCAARRRHGHRLRKRRAFLQPHRRPALEIRPDQQRNPRPLSASAFTSAAVGYTWLRSMPSAPARVAMISPPA